jgi:hypothetical protein
MNVFFRFMNFLFPESILFKLIFNSDNNYRGNVNVLDNLYKFSTYFIYPLFFPRFSPVSGVFYIASTIWDCFLHFWFLYFSYRFLYVLFIFYSRIRLITLVLFDFQFQDRNNYYF